MFGIVERRFRVVPNVLNVTLGLRLSYVIIWYLNIQEQDTFNLTYDTNILIFK